ncbi:vanadium-dependent haloperoxidase [Streptomyces sp. NPDC004129]
MRASRPGGPAVVTTTALSLLLLLVTALAVPAATATADGHTGPAADPAAIRVWNALTTETVNDNLTATRPSGQAVIWQGFVSAAVYNAVVGIQGTYAPYQWQVRGPAGASPEAAAVAAAHRVLVTCFPASRTPLDAAFTTSLAGIPEGRAKTEGVAFGERAARHLIALREGDGRDAPVPFTRAPAPGVWRPTPPGFLPFIDTWLGTLRPMLLTSPAQFRPGEPPALASARYARDLNEVKTMGARTGSPRTPRQTETALFFGGNLAVQVQGALRDYTARHRLDIADTARMFAAVNASATDAVITAWDAKLHYGRWRPITAVRLADIDGNPATSADPQWEPLLVTPPHPDYISGHAAVTGAVTQTLSGILGTTRLDLNFSSEATGTTRHYDDAARLNEDMVDARVWAGIHFRSADLAGCRAGSRIGVWALAHSFRPLRSRPEPAAPRPACPAD